MTIDKAIVSFVPKNVDCTSAHVDHNYEAAIEHSTKEVRKVGKEAVAFKAAGKDTAPHKSIDPVWSEFGHPGTFEFALGETANRLKVSTTTLGAVPDRVNYRAGHGGGPHDCHSEKYL